MSSSEPISEELMPVANKLATIRRCLNEVLKFGGPFSARDLYPYQLALAQIEAIRVDGKFPARDGSLPEGQAILNAHLSESYEMIEVSIDCPYFPLRRPLLMIAILAMPLHRCSKRRWITMPEEITYPFVTSIR